MPEAAPVANFSDMEGYRTIVYDTNVVPDYIWQEAQKVHRESIRALLPVSEQYRADNLTHTGNLEKYRDSRVKPSILVGNEWNDHQIFRRPKFAATFDRSNQMVGGVLTADNSSALIPLPGPLWYPEAWLKMVTPPALNVPFFGNKRYVHLREAYTHPDAQAKLEIDNETVVSGIALNGIYFSIAQANQEQFLVDYPAFGDIADQELVNISKILGMIETPYNKPHTIEGYEEPIQRVQARRLGQVMQDIVEMPGARSAIEGMQTSRITRQSIKQDERERRKKNEKAYWHDFDVRQETKDWGK